MRWLHGGPFARDVFLNICPDHALLSPTVFKCSLQQVYSQLLTTQGQGKAHRKINHPNHQEALEFPIALVKASSMPKLAACPKVEHLAVSCLCPHPVADLGWDHQIQRQNVMSMANCWLTTQQLLSNRTLSPNSRRKQANKDHTWGCQWHAAALAGLFRDSRRSFCLTGPLGLFANL